MATERAELVIIGGGIVGCSAAALAAERGMRVTLVERSAIGAGASGRNLGAVQHPFDPALVPLFEETVAIYRELAAAGPDFPFGPEPAGLLMVSPDERVLAEQLATLDPANAPRADLLAPRQVRSLEPSLADDLWGLRLATGYPVPPHAATAAMANRARKAGATLATGSAAVPAVVHGRAVGVVLEGLRTIAADLVLVAAGPWSPYLLDPAGRWRPITATWGATAQLRMAAAPHHVVEEARVHSVNQPVEDDGSGRRPTPEATPSLFTVAAAAGVVTIGSTFLATEPDHRAMAPVLVGRGTRFLPALREAALTGTRACARPQSLDGRPLVGAVPGAEGLYLAAGHGPWGISCGPATARLVLDAMTDASAVPEPLAASRAGAPELREVSV